MPASRASVMMRVAGDAVEQRRADRRGVQHAVEHQEQVLARAFAEQAGGGQRDAFAEAEPPRFARDQLSGQVVAAGLRTGGNGVRREALPARHAGVDAVLEHAGAEIRAHRPGCDRDVGRRLRRQPEAAEPAERDRPQVGLAQRVRCEYLAACGVDLVERIGNRHVVDLRRGEQAAGVVVEPEDHRDRAASRRLRMPSNTDEP